MGFFDLRWRHAATIVVSAIGLAAALSLFIEGSGSVDALPEGPVRVYSDILESPEAPNDVYECGVNPKGSEGVEKLELPGKNGLKFSCAAGQTLGPPVGTRSTDIPEVFEYNTQTKGCNVTAAVKLTSLVEGATLTMAAAGSMGRNAEPVYTLNYQEAPSQDRSLCYTCNGAQLLSQKLRNSGDKIVKCEVHITVKAENTPSPPKPEGDAPPTGGDGTKPPSSGSNVPAITASLATAAGGFLARTFLL